MADNLSNFRDELDKIEQKIVGLNGVINDLIIGRMKTAVSRAQELGDAFEKGKNITVKLSNEISKLSNKIDVSLLKEDSLRRKINQSLNEGNRVLANRLTKQLRGITNERQAYEQLHRQLIVLQQLNEEKKKQNNLSIILKNNMKELLKSVTEMFTLAGFIKVLIDGALRLNKTSVELGKNFGYGANSADKIANNLKNIAFTSNNFNVTLKNAAEAMNEIMQSTGFISEYSANTLETQIMLTKQFGLTGEEAAGIYKFSVLTGKSSSKINDDMVGTYVATRNSLKVGVPFKQAMAEASKVSGNLAISLKNNPALIMQAVVQAKALGTSLEQSQQQAESLLNWESSIENELKAELLTGQQINLERARAAALQGDQITLMQELANQGMNLEKFEQMNVIARKSYAEALGLSTDALSEQLRKQKLAQESGKSLAQITKEEALEAEKRQTIQDKFNGAVEKLQDLLGNIVAGPLGTFLDMMTSLLSNAGVLYTIMGSIAVLMGGRMLVSIGKMVAGLWAAVAPSTARAAAEVTAAQALTLGLATVGIIAGLAAVMGALASASPKKAGDIISPADGKTQVSTKEGDLFELSKNDDLIAGPGIASKKGGVNVNNNIDLTPMINAINQVKASVDKLYNKDTSINMDGKKVGTTLMQGSYKVA